MGQDKIWDEYQNNSELQGLWNRDEGRIGYIAAFIPEKSKILSIGVGRGTLEYILAKKNVDVHCLDPSKKSVERLRETLKLKDKAQVGYSRCIPFKENYFDHVIMTEVLEHLSEEDLDQTREELFRVLKEGGQFIGSVPADEILENSLIVCPNCGEIFHRWGHLQSFCKDRLEGYLRASFDDVEVRRVVFANWPKLNWKGWLIMVGKKLQAILGIKGANQNFFFRARKEHSK